MTSAGQQLITLGWMVVTGAGIGFVFDLYRLARGLLRPRWFFTALGDGLFWLFVASFTFGVLLQVNFGEVRSYIFLGIFLGLFFYYRLLSPLVLKLALKILGFLNRILTLIRGIVTTLLLRPLARLLGLLFAPLRWFKKRVTSLLARGRGYARGMGNRLGQALCRPLRILYRLLKYKLLFFTRKK